MTCSEADLEFVVLVVTSHQREKTTMCFAASVTAGVQQAKKGWGEIYEAENVKTNDNTTTTTKKSSLFVLFSTSWWYHSIPTYFIG